MHTKSNKSICLFFMPLFHLVSPDWYWYKKHAKNHNFRQLINIRNASLSTNSPSRLAGACWNMLSTKAICVISVITELQIKHDHFPLNKPMWVQSGNKRKRKTPLCSPELTSCEKHVGMATLPARLSLWSPPDTRRTSAAWMTDRTEWGRQSFD